MLNIVSNITPEAFEWEYVFEYLLRDIEHSLIPLNIDTPTVENPLFIYFEMNRAVSLPVQEWITRNTIDGTIPKFSLLHFSNEWDYSQYELAEWLIKNGSLNDYFIYSDAQNVFRPYWQPLADFHNTVHIPVGWKSGFQALSRQIEEPYRPIRDACFFGQPKSDRFYMMNQMTKLPGGIWVHGNAGFNSDDCVSIETQIAAYRSSVVSPCPAGGSHPDTFRICEVLEAGGIPVLCKYGNFDYHHQVFGRNSPIPQVDNWEQLPQLVEGIKSFGPEMIAADIQAWYSEFKGRLGNLFQNCFANPEPVTSISIGEQNADTSTNG